MAWALLASLGLHLALVLALLWPNETLTVPIPMAEMVTEVELSPLPPQPIPTPPPPPPEPPSPPEPERNAKTAIPKPNLSHAPIREHSAGQKGPGGGTPSPSTRHAPGVAVAMLGATSGGGGGKKATGQSKDMLTQNAQDFILAQFVKMWRFDLSRLKGKHVVISAKIEINGDGTLGGAMNLAAPWDPGAIIPDFDSLPDNPVRQALESFLLALRLAQPLDLPPDDGKGWPRPMMLRFAIDDL
jgi:hypothetical protein